LFIPINDEQGNFRISSLVIGESGLNDNLISQLLEIWQNIFQADYGSFRSVLSGNEYTHNRDILYMAINKGKIISTCHLTMSLSNPDLGGLGEVLTLPSFRGMGLANDLCKLALEDFKSAGGKALFLGTSNPVAAQIYSKLGWQMIPGSDVMVHLTDWHSPGEFFASYFKESSKIGTKPGTASERIPIIPLIIYPHSWQVLDANPGIFSTRYVLQHSCMGLYPRYASLRNDRNGEWVAARNDMNQVVGLASLRLDKTKRCQVDGFMHPLYSSGWKFLINKILSEAIQRGAKICSAIVSAGDEEKLSFSEIPLS
jgi:GNAT superfamily N-acetyltransferase